MKIAIVALTDFQHFPTGGILTFVRRFTQAVGNMKSVEATLIGWSPEAAGSRAPRRVPIGRDHYEFFPVGYGRLQGVLPDRMQFFMSRGRWSSVLEAVGEVDAYYCHSPEAALRVQQVGCGAPIALHIHGAINTVGKSRFTLGRTRLVAAAYEALVLAPALRASKAVFATVSDPDFNALKRGRLVGEHSFCVRVPAMVNPPLNSLPNGKTAKALRLVCVGRLETIKGIDLVIQVVAELNRRDVPCELKIIGDGTGRPRLERLVARLSLARQVHFAGALGEEDVQYALAGADVFVSGSHQEGFSLALLEALAQGLPAVVTDVGSARDVVRDGVTGYVIDRRDASLFAERVIAAATKAASMRDRCVGAAKPYSSEVVSLTIVKALARMMDGDEAGFDTHRPAEGAGIVSEVHP